MTKIDYKISPTYINNCGSDRVPIDSDMLHLHDPELVQRATLLNNIMIENGRTIEKAALEQSNQLESLFTRFDKVIDIVRQNDIEILYDNIKIAEQKIKNLSNADAKNEKIKKRCPGFAKLSMGRSRHSMRYCSKGLMLKQGMRRKLGNGRAV